MDGAGAHGLEMLMSSPLFPQPSREPSGHGESVLFHLWQFQLDLLGKEILTLYPYLFVCLLPLYLYYMSKSQTRLSN